MKQGLLELPVPKQGFGNQELCCGLSNLEPSCVNSVLLNG